jgi:hypothetical protein
MGIWKRIEEALWTGPVVKDYGAISSGRYGAALRTISAMLARRDAQDRFIIKTSYKAFLSGSVQYLELDREAALRLRAALDDALERMS